MLNSTLFSLDREPMKPSPKRREPVLWLKRLVILSARDSASIVRNIEFRRGLNIIQTKQMETGGGLPAGHSVGKTLLMRLIRYTLGEPHFGTEHTERNVAATLETGFVVAHWRVDGADWIIVRPLNREESVESIAVQTDNWQQVVNKAPSGETPHKEFRKAVREAVFTDLPIFTLPRGRDAKWQDVLAWLSRDYQCGYRRANEWRHEDANSGPSLDREENSQIMQWLLGLMNQDEIDLKLKHRELLDEQTKHKREEDRQQSRLEDLRPALREKLELDEQTEVEDGQQTFDSVNPIKVISDKISSLQKLKAERHAESRIAEFENQRDALQAQLVDAEATIRSCKNLLTFYAKQIEEYERDPLKAYEKCQAEPCWIREKARETADDPAADDHLANLRSLHKEEGLKLSASRSTKASLENELQQANSRLQVERARVAQELSGIDESIGKWRGYEGDATTYQKFAALLSAARKSLKRSGRDVEVSNKVQKDVRSKHKNDIDALTQVYQQTLQRIFGEEANGQIQVDGNGLQPIPDKKLAPGGAAMSVMTTVLAFDIACVAASAYGVGQHPRFLMHDSPREGEMQPPLFRRLFEIVIDLEEQFDQPEDVSFQYIITTASELPEEIGGEESPYVCETLDALSEGGLLLKKKF